MKLYTKIALLFLVVWMNHNLYAQAVETNGPSKAYSHRGILNLDDANEYAADDASDVIYEILDVVGLKPNFETRAAAISNAAAVVYGGKRYILYDKKFIAAINNATRTDWAGISILAHEIGHHLNGHTLSSAGSNPNDELEADEFSGFVLRKLGASIQEAQAAMNAMSEDYETSTHPARNRRLTAIAAGWNKADDQLLASTKRVERSTSTQQRGAQSTQISQPAPSRTSSARIASKYILRDVYFKALPNEKFYLTTNLNLVRVVNNNLEVYGKMVKTGNNSFPFVLSDNNDYQIFVAANGYLVDSDGNRIGFLKEHKS